MKKIAICALTRGYHDKIFYHTLISRNISISKFLSNLDKTEYDFILLHEGNISETDKEYISSKTPTLDIKYWNIKEVDPKTAFDNNQIKINNDLCPPNNISNGFPIGYRHMCKFWSIQFLKYFKNYNYIVRIDEDCIVKNMDFSIIDHMENENIYFASPNFQEQDEPQVIDGLENLRLEYIKKYDIKEYTQFKDITCPYTNFMIVNVKKINENNKINEFLKMVDDCGCIYSNRWGDLPIWGVILDTIMDKKNYKEIKNIKYHHISHNKLIN
jgi:hypothetical protein